MPRQFPAVVQLTQFADRSRQGCNESNLSILRISPLRKQTFASPDVFLPTKRAVKWSHRGDSPCRFEFLFLGFLSFQP